jgi:hypothetical protein
VIWVECAAMARILTDSTSEVSITLVINVSSVTGSSPGSGIRNGRSAAAASSASPASVACRELTAKNTRSTPSQADMVTSCARMWSGWP